MTETAHSFWRQPVGPEGVRVTIALLGLAACWMAVNLDRPSMTWRLVPLVLAGAAGYGAGWGARGRRAQIEAAYGLRPRRPDEPPPLDDQPRPKGDGPVGGAPVA